MVEYDQSLIKVSLDLLGRGNGQRGQLAGARIRRSISTTYYALFHFILDEVGQRVVGSHNDLRRRRRILARSVTHKGLLAALNKLRGAKIDESIAEFLRPPGVTGPVSTPVFVGELANVFADAQWKRHDADYDLNKPLGESDARLLRARVERAIRNWRAARSAADKDMKHAICVLILLGGQLRSGG